MKRATLYVALVLCGAAAVAQARPQEAAVGTANSKLKHEAFVPESSPRPYNPLQKKVNITGLVDTRAPNGTFGATNATGNLAFIGTTPGVSGVTTRAIDINSDGQVERSRLGINAQYPDPVLVNPNGWRVGAKANATQVIATGAGDVKVYTQTRADAKLAPAIALAGTNVLSPGTATSYTDATAYARPGLQYGVTLANAEQHMQSTNEDFWAGEGASFGAVRARAVAGQGQTVALGKNVMKQNVGQAFSDVRVNANSARWYLAPGHAIAGAANIGQSGRVWQYTQGRSRAEQGTAEVGVLNYGVSNGAQPFTFQGSIANNIYSEIDNRANADAGAANAGFLNIQRSYGSKVAIRNFPGAAAATAIGNAAAGGVSLAYSETGKAQIGDYDQENDTPENDVAATTRGRGTAEAGLISIAIAPNDDAEALGDVKATANQGAAVAGAFTETNAYQTAEQGVDVNARTSEYDAVAGNIGVAQAMERTVIANSATAKTTTGSALAFNEANGAVAKQNSATASSDATTTTGQAAAISAAQGVGGVHSDSQGAASATTSTGNALSLGTAISGAMYTTRAVSTSAAASKDGQAVSASLSGSVSADSTADTASSAATTTGNAASAAQGYGLGIFQGKATVASSAGTEEGSAGSLAVGVSTGLVQAQSRVASSAETKDGRAQSLAGSLAAAGINSVSSATSSGASETGDVTSNAQSFGLGVFHGEAAATSSSSTGCVDCVSDSVANAIATGVVADALARSAADSDKNPGNALANAISVGLISRTSNGGSSRIAVGPAQAISGGFAVSAGKKVQDKMASAVNPASKKEAVAAATKEQKA